MAMVEVEGFSLSGYLSALVFGPDSELSMLVVLVSYMRRRSGVFHYLPRCQFQLGASPSDLRGRFRIGQAITSGEPSVLPRAGALTQPSVSRPPGFPRGHFQKFPELPACPVTAILLARI